MIKINVYYALGVNKTCWLSYFIFDPTNSTFMINKRLGTDEDFDKFI